MIAKTGMSGSFFGAMEYVLGKGDDAQVVFKQQLGAVDTAARLAGSMQMCASVNGRVKEPVYHIIVSWDPEDQVTPDQMAEVAQRTLQALDRPPSEMVSEHQAVAVRHTDRGHPHMHLILNRVHPEHGQTRPDGSKTRTWRGWKAWQSIEELFRDMEREHGWRRVEGTQSIQVGYELPTGKGMSQAEYQEAKKNGALAFLDRRGRDRDAVLQRAQGVPVPKYLPQTKKEFYGVWKAAERNGRADCMWKMGQMYEMGAGVKRDLRHAMGWYARAMDAGHEKARHCYEALEERGYRAETPPRYRARGQQRIAPPLTKRQFYGVRAAAKKGSAHAQWRMGLAYMRGVDGVVAQDLIKARQWLRLAAGQGHTRASQDLQLLDHIQGRTGLVSLRPDGAKQPLERVLEAAQMGDEHAMWKMGRCYALGLGVERNERFAMACYRAALEHGHPLAAADLEMLAGQEHDIRVPAIDFGMLRFETGRDTRSQGGGGLIRWKKSSDRIGERIGEMVRG